MTFKERFNAAESKAGVILMKVSAMAATLVTMIQLNDQAFAVIPPGFFPDWLKAAIGFLAIFGMLAAKFTVHEEPKE